MDCFYHHAVPSVAPCAGCGRPVCATCRTETGDCPGCRLAERIDAKKAAARGIPGDVGPSYGTYQAPPPPQYRPAPRRSAAIANVRTETRALVALGYPFWPLALLALFDPSRSPFVRRNALQAIGFNFGMYGLGMMLAWIASIPVLGISAWPLLPFVIPVTVVASVIYGFRAFHGDDVNVPVVSEWVDKFAPDERYATEVTSRR